MLFDSGKLCVMDDGNLLVCCRIVVWLCILCVVLISRLDNVGCSELCVMSLIVGVIVWMLVGGRLWLRL